MVVGVEEVVVVLASTDGEWGGGGLVLVLAAPRSGPGALAAETEADLT